jgi:dolichol-phosphate mannosyltransferase
MLGLGVHDATAGYRAYRRSALERMDLSTVASQGYCFQVDLTRRATAAGLRIVEVPITFVEREVGDSKMSGAILGEALWRVTQWGVAGRARQLKARSGR